MLLIADSSALIAVSTYNGLHLLDQLHDKVIVPEAVYNEVTIDNRPEANALKSYLSDKVMVVDSRYQINLDAYADFGETQAMILYKQLGADKLLIDDLRGRKVAQINQIRIIGSLGILLQAKQKHLIDSVAPYIQRLQNSHVHLSQSAISAVLELANE